MIDKKELSGMELAIVAGGYGDDDIWDGPPDFPCEDVPYFPWEDTPYEPYSPLDVID